MSTIIILVGLFAMAAIAAYGWIEWYQEAYEEKLDQEKESHQRLMKEIRRHD